MIQQITQSIKPAFYQSGTQSITYTRKDSCLSDIMLMISFASCEWKRCNVYQLWSNFGWQSNESCYWLLGWMVTSKMYFQVTRFPLSTASCFLTCYYYIIMKITPMIKLTQTSSRLWKTLLTWQLICEWGGFATFIPTTTLLFKWLHSPENNVLSRIASQT